jgi:hypothetical protein
LACGVGATLIPLTPYADYFPDNPMGHQQGTAIPDENGNPLRLCGVNLGGWLHREGWEFRLKTQSAQVLPGLIG